MMVNISSIAGLVIYLAVLAIRVETARNFYGEVLE